MSRPTNPGWFRPGPDPRRHTLTVDDCRRGFHVALAHASKPVRRWLLARVEATSRPETVDAFRRRRQADYEQRMSS
jgi:hypothetical protein